MGWIKRCPNCGAENGYECQVHQCDDCGKLYCTKCYDRGKSPHFADLFPLCDSSNWHSVVDTKDLKGDLPGIN